MKKLLISFLLTLTIFSIKAQNAPYQFAGFVSESQSEVTFKVYVFGNDKKQIDQDAMIASLRCLMFDGVADSKFNKPLLREGEQTLMDQFPEYFESLYGWRCSDYVKNLSMLSKFKKSGNGKSTLYEVTVKVFDLRKDLEKNKVKKWVICKLPCID